MGDSWPLGLTLFPNKYSSGGKSRLQGISKRDDRYLRLADSRCARRVASCRGKNRSAPLWLQQLIARRA